jgi:putative DNA primase/helicase
MIEMRRMLPDERILEFESDEVEELFSPVRKKLEEFARENESRYRNLRPELPRESLNPRARDLWKPLYKVAECAGGEWIKKAFLASVALSSGESDPEEASLSLRLLHDTREIFTEEQLATKDLIERLRELEESPWSYLERFNPSVLAHLLKNYGIKPRPFSGGKVRGYYRKSFEDPWSRYLDPVQTVTPVTLVTLEELDLEAS